MGFSSYGSDTFTKMLITATKKGESHRGNRRVIFTGEPRIVDSFEGLVLVPSGIITCYYYNTKIFAVDFDKKLITNFGMRSYSQSTGQNISGWSHAIQRLLWGDQLTEVFWEYVAWSFVSRGEPLARRQRFARKVPWVHIDANKVGWFHWPLWNAELSQTYYKSEDFLAGNQNWRYFDFDWAPDGTWQKKFIDDNARRRWEARERKHGRPIDGHVSL